ncbi:MAG: hypothetical protein RL654_3379 [Pseudomonadota bacterium]
MMKDPRTPSRPAGLTVALAFTAALAACGGGDGETGTSGSGATAEGVYGGTLTGSTSNAFQLLVLETGEFWALYGIPSASTFGVTGFLQGAGTSSNGIFTAAGTQDFGSVPAVSGATSAVYNATAKTITGTVRFASGSVGFSGGPMAASLYHYDSAASLATVAGTWVTTGLTGESVTLRIAASTGALTASSSLGCSFAGTVVPRPSGKNVFNVSLIFGAAPCAWPGQTASGIAVAYPVGTGQTQLLVAVTDSSRTVGTALVGVR